jgi:CHAD domain-containing protein
MKAESVRLTAEMDAAQAFQTIAFSCIRHFRVNEPLVISARDVDALHQSRVALRRLRSSFSLFRPLLTDPALERFKTELRWLSATLGEARNLDVLLRRRSEELSRKSRKALIEVRGIAYDRAIAALRSVSVETATIDLAEWIALGSFGEHGPQGDLPIAPFSATVLDRFWKKVRRCGKDLFDLDDEERHELRIAGKKLRYAGEFFSDLYGGDMLDQRNAFLAEMSALQDHLGALNDMATERTLEERLRALKIVLPDGSEDKSEDDVGENLARAHASVMKLTEITPFWR